MKSITKASRTNNILEVIQHMNNGIIVVEAAICWDATQILIYFM